MKILVLGGAGFVGRNLVRLLSQKKFPMKNVYVIDKDNVNMEYIRKFCPNTMIADLAEHGSWGNWVKGKDYVVNLAAQISSNDPNDFVRNNVTDARNMIAAIKKHSKNARVIHFSSAAVLSVRKDDYAKTKKESENLVTKSGLRYFTIRPSLMYGPTDTKNIGYLIRFAQAYPFFPIPGTGKYIRQPLYIDDVNAIIINAMKRFPAKNTIIGINGKEKIYFCDMIKAVLDELGGFRFRVFLPVWIFKALMAGYQGLVGKQRFTADQVDSLTGGDVFPDYPWWDIYHVKPTSFREGVRKMIPFYRKK